MPLVEKIRSAWERISCGGESWETLEGCLCEFPSGSTLVAELPTASSACDKRDQTFALVLRCSAGSCRSRYAAEVSR